jgi:NADH:ubiquinone oxidoreductase subunit B-like Fe-S oxidoreductase
LNEVKDERRREMVMEGTRLFDLKRWHMGVTRSLTQQDDLCLFPGSTVTTKLTKAANDPKMILPIPKAEIDANPKCKQNPGY